MTSNLDHPTDEQIKAMIKEADDKCFNEVKLVRISIQLNALSKTITQTMNTLTTFESMHALVCGILVELEIAQRILK